MAVQTSSLAQSRLGCSDSSTGDGGSTPEPGESGDRQRQPGYRLTRRAERRTSRLPVAKPPITAHAHGRGVELAEHPIAVEDQERDESDGESDDGRNSVHRS